MKIAVTRSFWLAFRNSVFVLKTITMNKIEVKCCINGEPEMGISSLYVSRTESWDQVLYKISLKVNKPQGANSVVYNELGGQITSVAELEDGDKIYFSVNGDAFVPPKSSGIKYLLVFLGSDGEFETCSSEYRSYYARNLFFSFWSAGCSSRRSSSVHKSGASHARGAALHCKTG